MNNSAAKVGEIFREAGTAFTKLSEMTLMLQPTDDATPGSKWSEEDVEMLRGCVNRFAVELNKISQHIKNRTMSYLRSLLELDTGNIYDVSRWPTHLSQALQITPPALDSRPMSVLLEQHHLTIQTHQQELVSPQACQLRHPNLQAHEHQQFGNPQGFQEHAIHNPQVYQQERANPLPLYQYQADGNLQPYQHELGRPLPLHQDQLVINQNPYQQQLGWPLPWNQEQPISNSYPYQQERGRPLPWHQDRPFLHPHQQEFGSPQLMHQNNTISQQHQSLLGNPQPLLGNAQPLQQNLLVFPHVQPEHSFAWEPDVPQINKTRKLPTVSLQRTTQLEVSFPEDNDAADLRHFNPGIVPLTPPINIMQDDVLPSPNIMQEDTPPPANIMREDTPCPANIMREDTPSPDNIMREDTPSPDNIMREDTPSPDNIMREDTPSPDNIMQEINPRPANVMPEDILRPAEFDDIEDIPRPAEFDDTEDIEVIQTCAVITGLMPILDLEFSRFMQFPFLHAVVPQRESHFRNFPIEGNNIVDTVNEKLMLVVKRRRFCWSTVTKTWERNKLRAIKGNTTGNIQNQEIENLPKPEVSSQNSLNGDSTGDVEALDENSCFSILSTDNEDIYITNQNTPQLNSDPVPGAFSSIFVQNNCPLRTSYNSVDYAESELKPHLCKPFSTDPFCSLTSNHFLNDNSCSEPPVQTNILQWDDPFFQFSNMEKPPKVEKKEEKIGPFSSLFERKDQDQQTEIQEQKLNSNSSNLSVEAMSETTGNVRSKQTQNNKKPSPSSSQRTRGSRGRGSSRRRGARGRCVARASADMSSTISTLAENIAGPPQGPSQTELLRKQSNASLQDDDTEKPILKRRKKTTIVTTSSRVTRSQNKNRYQ